MNKKKSLSIIFLVLMQSQAEGMRVQRTIKLENKARVLTDQGGCTKNLNLLLAGIDMHNPDSCAQPLIEAAQEGYDMLVAFITGAIPIESTQSKLYTAAYYKAREKATRNGHSDILSYLLHNPNYKNRKGHTILSIAVKTGNLKIVEKIVPHMQDFTYGYGDSVTHIPKDEAIKQVLYAAIKEQRSLEALHQAIESADKREQKTIRRAEQRDKAIECATTRACQYAAAVATLSANAHNERENMRTLSDTPYKAENKKSDSELEHTYDSDPEQSWVMITHS